MFCAGKKIRPIGYFKRFDVWSILHYSLFLRQIPDGLGQWQWNAGTELLPI